MQKQMPVANPNPECVSIPRRSVLSNLSLEAYMDMHAALTKGSLPKVQKVSDVERAMYKMNDLKQVCHRKLHSKYSHHVNKYSTVF